MRGPFTCVICTVSFFVETSRGANPKVCSDACRNAYTNEYNRRYAEARKSGTISAVNEVRSSLRKFERAERRGDLHTAHVRLYERTFSPGERVVLTCLSCSHQFRRLDAIWKGKRRRCPKCGKEPGFKPTERRAAGRRRYANKPDEVKRAISQKQVKRELLRRKRDAKYREKVNAKKRLARICGLPGEKQIKHVVHVKTWE